MENDIARLVSTEYSYAACGELFARGYLRRTAFPGRHFSETAWKGRPTTSTN